MNRWLKATLPVVILGACALIAWQITRHPVEAKKRGKEGGPSLLSVEIAPLVPTDYQVHLRGYGLVGAQNNTTLTSRVQGEIIRISPQLENGAAFQQGDFLLQLDKTDYEQALMQAKATLAAAALQLSEENARAEQAVRDWQLIKGTTPLPDLVARRPQLHLAEANLGAAKAGVARAKRDLARTRLSAPYHGRVAMRKVSLGQFVTPNTPLATLYTDTALEVRIPVTDRALAFLPPLSSRPKVLFTLHVGQQVVTRGGYITRIDNVVDPVTRQVTLIGIVQPENASLLSSEDQQQAESPHFRLGRFVEVDIFGHYLQQVFVVPRSRLYDGDTLIVVKAQRLERRRVQVVWQDARSVVINAGIEAGEQLLTTPLGGTPVSGTAVRVIGIPKQKAQRGGEEKQRGTGRG